MTLDNEKKSIPPSSFCLSSSDIKRRFTKSLIALHWRGWFFFYKASHKRMMVWSTTHVIGFNRGNFAQLRNTMQWQWWFGILALEVKCQELLTGDKRHAYFLNQLEDCKVVRNWKIFESGKKNRKLTIQCLEHESSRLVLQADGRQYSYWGRRPESGVVVFGDESLHIQKNIFPVPVGCLVDCVLIIRIKCAQINFGTCFHDIDAVNQHLTY